jgi:hypothetical protein
LDYDYDAGKAGDADCDVNDDANNAEVGWNCCLPLSPPTPLE